jgi:hypothetical protein
LFLFEATFTSFFKDKKSERHNKTVGINDILLFLFHNLEPDPEPNPYIVLLDSDPGGPKAYGSGSATLPLAVRYMQRYQQCKLKNKTVVFGSFSDPYTGTSLNPDLGSLVIPYSNMDPFFSFFNQNSKQLPLQV